MMRGYTNNETLQKHSRSVFPQCFPNGSSWRRHTTCFEDRNPYILKAGNAFEIFQKHFLLPICSFVSRKMFPCLCQPYLTDKRNHNGDNLSPSQC